MRSQGNPDFVNKMVHVFLETTVESLEEMVICQKEKKIKQVAALAHKIKPSIDLMGITSLTDVVRSIEKNGREDGAELETLVPRLEEVLRAVFEEMKRDFQKT
jgi:HPt (histidine-containing phosphotransfer) domain-containing protein